MTMQMNCQPYPESTLLIRLSDDTGMQPAMWQNITFKLQTDRSLVLGTTVLAKLNSGPLCPSSSILHSGYEHTNTSQLLLDEKQSAQALEWRELLARAVGTVEVTMQRANPKLLHNTK